MEQIDVVQREAVRLGLQVQMICGDSSEPIDVANGWADLIFSCPPYADLEVYSENPADLSYQAQQDYGLFLESYGRAIDQCYRIAKSPAFMVLVVGNLKDLDLRMHTVDLAEKAGFERHDEIIYKQPTGTAPMRAYVFRVNRRTIRNHEYILVFRKGDLEDFRNGISEQVDA